MLEPAKNVLESNFLNVSLRSVVRSYLRASLERAQDLLDL
jgi:hypothetical protein